MFDLSSDTLVFIFLVMLVSVNYTSINFYEKHVKKLPKPAWAFSMAIWQVIFILSTMALLTSGIGTVLRFVAGLFT